MSLFRPQTVLYSKDLNAYETILVRPSLFVNAHPGWMGNDLAKLGELLDKCPNVQTEIAAVLYELGRQPRFAREWLIRYQDRVMFGKDTWAPSEYPT